MRIADLVFDPGPDCTPGCLLTDGYCDLTCVWPSDEPLRWDGDDG